MSSEQRSSHKGHGGTEEIGKNLCGSVDSVRDIGNLICDGDGKKTGGLLKYLLLGIITFGIYDLVWLYMLGDRLQDNAKKYNLSFKESGGTVLLWFLLGAFIVVQPFLNTHPKIIPKPVPLCKSR
ncbi:MAG: DUF4234 domain-containing protein [Treponema sp.]|nr:DUF4234 domain-containing protein [Treponema sp.]